jgi:CRP/FNR family transcriptional regulator, cyclic AMP receptor protein
MDRKRVNAGDMLWQMGDKADMAVYIWSGSVELVEIGRSVHEGALIGEMGLFNPAQKRMLSARCETDCEIGTISYAEFRVLYHQNPEFGFYLMRLITGRLQENLDMAANPRGRLPA